MTDSAKHVEILVSQNCVSFNLKRVRKIPVPIKNKIGTPPPPAPTKGTSYYYLKGGHLIFGVSECEIRMCDMSSFTLIFLPLRPKLIQK